MPNSLALAVLGVIYAHPETFDYFVKTGNLVVEKRNPDMQIDVFTLNEIRHVAKCVREYRNRTAQPGVTL